MKIVYAKLRGRDIYNSCNQEYQYPVSVKFRGRWWNDEFSELRELIAQWFVDAFERYTGGHYTKLRASVLESGFLNPIVVTSGKPLRRDPWMVPNYPQKYICEQNGGSRLMLAQELDMDIPCIVNGDAPGEELHNVGNVREKFTDKTYQIKIDSHCGVMTIPRRLMHLDDFTMAHNHAAVTKARAEVVERADKWLKASGIC